MAPAADDAAPMPPRLALRAGEAPTWNALLSHQETPIGFGALTVTFGFAALPGAATQARVSRGQIAPLRAAITSFPVADLFGETFDAAEINTLPTALRDAVCRAIFTALTSVLPGGLGDALSVDLVNGADETPHDVAFRVTIEGAFSAPATLLIAGAPSAILATLGARELAALARHPQLAAAIPVRARLSLGTLNVTTGEAQALSPGDILIAPPGARKDAIAMTIAGRVRPLTRTEAGWTIGVLRMDDPQGEGSPAPASLHDLPVRLEFHLGEIALPLSAVETLSEGAVLPLEAVTAEGVPVTVRANGTAIAEGDLVQLDDRLGVRLTRVGVRAIEDPAGRADDAP
ncbi:MAG: FliM/FliN family flagellar motor switch protein [Pseudomonadota bacterium]